MKTNSGISLNIELLLPFEFLSLKYLRRRFECLDFNDILSDLNMTRNEYINALRMSVKGKYTVFHEQRPENLFTNNYNPGI